ncbi:CPBP family intramembrane glutamic endopeptidase [Halorubrum aethiopicum]|uniref:CPBP family intramembrane glutamic endopeptidase n=1 Tax=Halorubrum aethiopicum TaxID=1758255 RepID=UPI000830B9B0|nr:CPBP family intramembrane glutamic endopeptidase [Halorubrum aethiopicum]
MSQEKTSFGGWTAEIPRPTVANLAIALCVLPLFALLERTVRFHPSPVGEIAFQWGCVAAVVGVAVAIEGCSLADLGVRRPTATDLAYALGTALAAFLVFAGTDPLVTALGLPTSAGAGAMSTGVGIGLALVRAVTTGVVEEVLYRGYAIERLAEYTPRPAIAGGISWGAFTLAHAVVWPIGNLLQVAAVSAAFTLVYLRRRSLFTVIGSHVLVWCLAVLGHAYG